MKLIIFTLFFSLTTLAATKVETKSGFQITCIDIESPLFFEADAFCEVKSIKSEKRFCSFRRNPDKPRATEVSVDCAFFDEVQPRK